MKVIAVITEPEEVKKPTASGEGWPATTRAGTRLRVMINLSPYPFRGFVCLRCVPWTSKELCFSFGVLGVVPKRYNYSGICSARLRIRGRVASIASTGSTFGASLAHCGL